jgi:hypothetical protein
VGETLLIVDDEPDILDTLRGSGHGAPTGPPMGAGAAMVHVPWMQLGRGAAGQLTLQQSTRNGPTRAICCRA